MDAASLPPPAPGRRSIRRENTPAPSRAPRSTTSGRISPRGPTRSRWQIGAPSAEAHLAPRSKMRCGPTGPQTSGWRR